MGVFKKTALRFCTALVGCNNKVIGCESYALCIHQLINKISRQVLIFVFMLACSMSCDAAAKKSSKEEASKDAALEGLAILFFQKGLNDDFDTVRSSGNTNHISSNGLSAYEKFCISNNYRGRSAQENVLIYEKTATDFSSYFKSNKPRFKACTLSMVSILHLIATDIPIIEQHAHSGRYKDAIDIAKGRLEQVVRLDNINIDGFDEYSPQQYRSNLLESKERLQNIIHAIENLEKDDKQQQLSQKKSKVKYIDYSTGKIYCEGGYVTDSHSDCKLDGNHYICESSANYICNERR